MAEPVRHDRGADPRAAPAQVLTDQHAFEAGERRPTVFLRDVNVHQPDLVRAGDQISRVRRVLVVRPFLGADLLLREIVRQLAQGLLLVGQGKGDPARDSVLQRRHERSVA